MSQYVQARRRHNAAIQQKSAALTIEHSHALSPPPSVPITTATVTTQIEITPAVPTAIGRSATPELMSPESDDTVTAATVHIASDGERVERSLPSHNRRDEHIP